MTSGLPISLGIAALLILLLGKIVSAPKRPRPTTTSPNNDLAGDDTAEPVVSKPMTNGGTSPMPPSL